MSLVLFNPTEDEFKAQYGGITVFIKPYPQDGHMVKFDDNKARHILNQLSARGLTTLDYGDEGEGKEKKAADGRKRNLDFKKKQILNYNRDNESRKMRQLEYVEPPEQIIEWAKDIGVKLIGPYELPDVKNEEISELRKELKKRDGQIDTLTGQVSQLLEAFQAGQTDPEPEDDDAEQAIAKYKSMNGVTLRARVKELGDKGYSELHIDVQSFLRGRWEEIFDKEELFPY